MVKFASIIVDAMMSTYRKLVPDHCRQVLSRLTSRQGSAQSLSAKLFFLALKFGAGDSKGRLNKQENVVANGRNVPHQAQGVQGAMADDRLNQTHRVLIKVYDYLVRS